VALQGLEQPADVHFNRAMTQSQRAGDLLVGLTRPMKRSTSICRASSEGPRIALRNAFRHCGHSTGRAGSSFVADRATAMFIQALAPAELAVVST